MKNTFGQGWQLTENKNRITSLQNCLQEQKSTAIIIIIVQKRLTFFNPEKLRSYFNTFTQKHYWCILKSLFQKRILEI